MSEKYKPITMLDSGAFSAWWRDEEIEVDAYLDFIKEYRDHFGPIVALDVIPGKKAKMAKTQKEIEAAAAQSYHNFAYMRDKGVLTVPVFHQGEDWKWLEKMLDEKVPYIGIAPYMRAHQGSILDWMDECFTRCCDAKGNPLVKTHGFGVTGFRLLHRYPWFTCDSTSWAISAGYGNILLPALGGPVPDFTRPYSFSLTERDTGGAKSLLHASGRTRELVDEYFDKLGVSFTSVRNLQEHRCIVNAAFYLGLERILTQKPFKHLRPGRKHRQRKGYVPFDYKPSLVFATMIKNTYQGTVLTNLRAKYRLLSYHNCRNYSREDIEEYTKYGFLDGKRRVNFRQGTKAADIRRRMNFLKRIETYGAMIDE